MTSLLAPKVTARDLHVLNLEKPIPKSSTEDPNPRQTFSDLMESSKLRGVLESFPQLASGNCLYFLVLSLPTNTNTDTTLYSKPSHFNVTKFTCNELQKGM